MSESTAVLTIVIALALWAAAAVTLPGGDDSADGCDGGSRRCQ